MITKKEIMNLLEEFKEGTPFGWKINHLAVLVQDDDMKIAIDYIGQGCYEDIYNHNYEKFIDIKEEFLNYKGLGGACSLEETTEQIYEIIKIETDI